MQRARRWRGLGLVPILLILVACESGRRDSSGQAGDTKWIRAEEAKAEYFAEAGKLDLAPGWRWPQDPAYADADPDGKGFLYGVNTGRVDAAWYWHCSWGRTYLEAQSKSDRDTALGWVLRLRESIFYEHGLLPADREERDKVLDAAAAGNATTLRMIIDSSCPKRSA